MSDLFNEDFFKAFIGNNNNFIFQIGNDILFYTVPVSLKF